MKLSRLLAFFLALGTLSVRAADTYQVDPAHSSVGFSITHMVINEVKGRFTEFAGTIAMNGGDIAEIKGTIQTKSIDTSIAKRDDHLRSKDFFDVATHPTITFTSKKVERKGDRQFVTGDYTMHGVTKEVTIPVTVRGPIKDMAGKDRIGLKGKLELNRKDYGLTWSRTLETGGLVVADEVEIELNAEAVKQ
jgi:polyisoprenoid-binding protein YceI